MTSACNMLWRNVLLLLLHESSELSISFLSQSTVPACSGASPMPRKKIYKFTHSPATPWRERSNRDLKNKIFLASSLVVGAINGNLRVSASDSDPASVLTLNMKWNKFDTATVALAGSRIRASTFEQYVSWSGHKLPRAHGKMHVLPQRQV